MWKAGELENHWTVLVRATVAKAFVPQRHAVRELPPSNPTDADRRRMPATFSKFLTPMERVRAWKERNGAAKGGSGN